MQFFKKMIVALLCISTLTAVAQPSKFEWKQVQAGGYTYKYVTNDPSKARFYTLKNGLTVILSPTNKDPRIQAYVAVKASKIMKVLQLIKEEKIKNRKIKMEVSS